MEFDKEKSTILLMHGSGLTHIVWSFHEQFYSTQGFNVLSVDLPGHGNSEGPSLKSIEEISDWIKSLMKKKCSSQRAAWKLTLQSLPYC